jgi:hypothetical protein
MPKSRRRHDAKRHRSWIDPRRKAEIAEFFEHTVRTSSQLSPFQVLYHYTSTAVAQSILSNQEFWATAHDCTNDSDELISATEVVLEIARFCRTRSKKAAVDVFEVFLQNYPAAMLSEMRTVYLSCFSTLRDDAGQWKSYGRNGSGACLGLRVLEEPGVVHKSIVSALFEVVYSEDALRESLIEPFDSVRDRLSALISSRFVCEEGLSALYRLAAHAAIRAKHEKWSCESEVRLATFARTASDVQPRERVGDDGQIKRYIPIHVRADKKLIALDEIILGAGQDTANARQEFEAILAAKGYEPGSIEFPRITVTSVVPMAQSSAQNPISGDQLHE